MKYFKINKLLPGRIHGMISCVLISGMLTLISCSNFMNSYPDDPETDSELKEPSAGFVISNNDDFAYCVSTGLQIDCSGVLEMRFMNEGGEWSEWTGFNTSLDWVLPYGTGIKRVYGEFRTHDNNVLSGMDEIFFIDCLFSDNGNPSDLFGSAVSVSGDGTVLCIGSKGEDLNGKEDSGNVAFYTFLSNQWQQMNIEGLSLNAFDSCGASLGISSDGTVAAVGIPGSDTAGQNAGAIQIYYWNPGSETWETGPVIVADDAAEDDAFGSVISLSPDGNSLAAGVPADDIEGNVNQGSVYLFSRNIDDSWVFVRRITASNGSAHDHFGISCSLSNNASYLAVGAEWKETTGCIRNGALYVYENPLTSADEIELSTDVTMAYQYTGSGVSLSLDGSMLAAGARGYNNDQGAVYVFHYETGSFVQKQCIVPEDVSEHDQFGSQVSICGDGSRLIAGAPYSKVDTYTARGSVYVFTRSGDAYGLWDSISLSWEANEVPDVPDACTGDLFGSVLSQSYDGSTALISSAGRNNSSGCVYIYR